MCFRARAFRFVHHFHFGMVLEKNTQQEKEAHTRKTFSDEGGNLSNFLLMPFCAVDPEHPLAAAQWDISEDVKRREIKS